MSFTVNDFRIAVGLSLKGKIEEHAFFLQKIAEVSKIIEQKHFKKDYPLNKDLDQLNYFFSAYLNTIQSIKDGCQTSIGITLSWSALSPSYGDFIFYCRNSATHDGEHLINAGMGIKNYIAGPLKRIDGRGNLIEISCPKEDVLTLCQRISEEILSNVATLLKQEGVRIPVDEKDPAKIYDEILKSDFNTNEVKNMMEASKESALVSLRGFKPDVINSTLQAIDFAKNLIANI